MLVCMHSLLTTINDELCDTQQTRLGLVETGFMEVYQSENWSEHPRLEAEVEPYNEPDASLTMSLSA